MTTPPPPESDPQQSHWAKDGAEEDRVEGYLKAHGCWLRHLAVVDCMEENKDWRRCQDVVRDFRDCIQRAKANDRDARALAKELGVKEGDVR